MENFTAKSVVLWTSFIAMILFHNSIFIEQTWLVWVNLEIIILTMAVNAFIIKVIAQRDGFLKENLFNEWN